MSAYFFGVGTLLAAWAVEMESLGVADVMNVTADFAWDLANEENQ